MSGDFTKEDYDRAIELTPEQKKAWKKFEEAVKGLRKTNVYIYQMLAKIGGLNGDHVERVTDASQVANPLLHPGCLQYLDYPGIEVSDAWADDSHVVILTREGIRFLKGK
jgi:hypothetical protein